MDWDRPTDEQVIRHSTGEEYDPAVEALIDLLVEHSG